MHQKALKSILKTNIMPGSKQQCSVEIIQKILNKNFPDYLVIGNQPYHTSTLLLKKDGTNFLLIKSYDKNNALFREMIQPGWFPGKDAQGDSLFADQTTTTMPLVYNRYLLGKLADLLKSAEDIGKHFGITVEEQAVETRRMYLKIIKNGEPAKV